MIGSILFITLFSAIVWYIWQTRHYLKDPLLIGMNHWALGFITAILVAGISGAILDAYPANLIFWLILGIATRLPKYEEKPDLQLPGKPATFETTPVNP